MALTTREKEAAKQIIKAMPTEQRNNFVRQFAPLSAGRKQQVTLKLLKSQGTQRLTFGDVGEIAKTQAIQAGKETGQRALGLIEGLTGGIPRELLELGVKGFTNKNIDLPKGDVTGRIIGSVHPSGIVARGGKAILAALPGKSGTQRVGRELLAGFTGGALATPVGEGETIIDRVKARAIQGGFSALIGGAILGTGSIISGLGKSFDADKLAIEAKNALVQFKRSRGARRQQTGMASSDAINRAAKRTQQLGQEAIEAEQRTFAQTNKVLAGQLTDEVNSVATNIKEPLNKSIKAVSQRYGAKLDEAIDVASEINPGSTSLSPTQVKQVQSDVLEELESLGVDFPNIRSAIEKSTTRLLGKQPKVVTQSQSVSQLIRGKTPPAPPARAISLKEIAKERKIIGSMISKSSKGGTSRFDPEELAVSIYNRRLGQEISSRIDIGGLNATYADSVDMMKFVYKNFRTKTGDLDIKAGARILKNLGVKSDFDIGDMRAINKLQQGNELFPGVGDFTRGIREVGGKIKQAQEVQPEVIAEARRTLQRRISGLQKKADVSRRRRSQIQTELTTEIEVLEDMAKGLRSAKKIGARGAIVVTEGLAAVGLYKLLFNRG